ncbi:MAG: hypothetical protein ACOH17_11110 [Cellulomonas sp.]
MKRHVLAGIFLAVLAALIVLLSGMLGPDVQSVVLLGAALGGALGLVPDRSPTQRVGAFGVGFVAAWIGYLLRAAALPDAPSGRAVAVLVVLLVCLAVAAATRGRLPLWAALIGAGAMAGSYEAAYAADPTAFLASSPASATAVLLTAAAGFVATALLGPTVADDRALEHPATVAPEQVHTPAREPGRERPPQRTDPSPVFRSFEPNPEA